jgi:hypothetical protein
LVGEGIILVADQQDGGKKTRQISTPVSAFTAIVGLSLKCVLYYHSISGLDYQL